MKEYDRIKSHLGDIRDKDSIRNCFSRFKPDVVINTAALKHVPICETNSIESVKTNILGHQNVIETMREFTDIETLIFVSTDKACKPINIYGMCKAISEKLYSNYAETETDTKVVTVRSGEKLHEEMISQEEWFRTEDDENYLINNKNIKSDLWSYNSKDSLMDESETYKFLQDSGVIK